MQTRKSPRNPLLDYSRNGLYFITFNTKNWVPWFGEIRNGKMILNKYGNIFKESWEDLPNHYENCRLDESIIMPDHFHGIIRIENRNKNIANMPLSVREGLRPSRTYPRSSHKYPSPSAHESSSKPNRKHAIPEMIRALKSFSSRRINEQSKMRFQWHRSFYDHIIRDEIDYSRIRKYIRDNPKNFRVDKFKNI